MGVGVAVLCPAKILFMDQCLIIRFRRFLWLIVNSEAVKCLPSRLEGAHPGTMLGYRFWSSGRGHSESTMSQNPQNPGQQHPGQQKPGQQQQGGQKPGQQQGGQKPGQQQGGGPKPGQQTQQPGQSGNERTR